jgi:hypothetical protein
MTDIVFASPRTGATPKAARLFDSPGAVRALLLIVITAAVVAGFLVTGDEEMARATRDADLTRLLRAMTAIKGLMVAGAAASVLWRLGSAITPPWFAAYALACCAMAAGPGLIWNMAHLGAGALLLHGGLVATVLLVWRDPAVSARLEALIAARRAAIRAGSGR